ncbi:MAG: Mu transposase domain-containing protein [Acidimicrobiales bacterium]
MIDSYMPKLEEWMEQSRGKVRADVAHDKLAAMGYQGSERTTRRIVAEARKAYRDGHRRVYRPWVPSPASGSRGLRGRPAGGRDKGRTVLRMARLEPLQGGAPAQGQDAPEPHRGARQGAPAFRGPYGPESKGGSEATVRVAKADLVPTGANLLPAYADWASLEAACEALCEELNSRPHRVTRRAPAEMLAEERPRLHRLPEQPYATAFGMARRADPDMSVINLDWCQYSVHHELAGEVVWARLQGNEVVITHIGPARPTEVARHELTTPGNPRVNPAHYPPAPETPLHRTPVAQNGAEAGFLAIGPGAALWLTEAAPAGASRRSATVNANRRVSARERPRCSSVAEGSVTILSQPCSSDVVAEYAHRAEISLVKELGPTCLR